MPSSGRDNSIHYKGSSHSLAVCHKTVKRDLEILDILQNITLVQFTNDIMLTGSQEQAIARIPDVLERHMHTRVREKISTVFQGCTTLLRFQGHNSLGAWQGISSKV